MIICSLGDYELHGDSTKAVNKRILRNGVPVIELDNWKYTLTEEGLKAPFVEDMTTLLNEFKNIIDRDALAFRFLNSREDAVRGFVHFLNELEDLSVYGYDAYMRADKGNYYVVGTQGLSWFKSSDTIKPTTYFGFPTKTWNENIVKEGMRAYNIKHRDEYGDIDALAMLVGEFDWQLTYRMFAWLHVPLR